jgi:hypothetical protein
VLLSAGGLPTAQGAERALPENVIVRDGRTSPPMVDISEARLAASWFADSEQIVRVKVPRGFRPGHQVTVWFDVNGDSTPDGRLELGLRKPKRPGEERLQTVQEFRLGGGWDGAGTRVRCYDSDGYPAGSGHYQRGQRLVAIGLDLWWCLKRPRPATSDAGSGSWRAAVRVARGTDQDMAPNHRTWSPPVAGWAPCHPEQEPCPGLT